MGREAKARQERRAKRLAALSKPAPHPEGILAWVDAQHRQRVAETLLNASQAADQERMQAAGWKFAGE